MSGGICIAGRAGSGKSPLAQHIVSAFSQYGIPAKKLSFADALKQEVWELYGVRKGDLGSRELLISHGEGRTALDPTYWVRRLMPRVEACWSEGAIPVVDDVRREPEFSRLSYESFFRVRVLAPLVLRRAALEKNGLDPDFATSDDPTERHHEVWRYDFRRVLMHTGQDYCDAAAQIVQASGLALRAATPTGRSSEALPRLVQPLPNC